MMDRDLLDADTTNVCCDVCFRTIIVLRTTYQAEAKQMAEDEYGWDITDEDVCLECQQSNTNPEQEQQ